jgi:hypothetical protein
MGRFKVLGAIALVLTALGLLCAPAAWADSTELIEGSSSVIDGGGDPIDKALDKANQTSNETTDKVDKTTDRVTDEVDDATGGNQGDEVDSVVSRTTGTLDQNVDYLTGPDGPVRETKATLLEALEQALGQATGNELTIATGGIDGFVDGSRHSRQEGTTAAGAAAATAATTAGEVNEATSLSLGAETSSLADQIENRIQDLVRAMAFPLILALLIGAFLFIQNRIDSTDPKMLLSAIDADQNYLNFR